MAAGALTTQCATTRSAVLARAKEYCQLSNHIGAIANTKEGRELKQRLLNERVHPMYHPDVDMFGLVGKEEVVPAVNDFFLDTYADGLRFEGLLNGNVELPAGWEDTVFVDDIDTRVTFEFAKYWSKDGKLVVVRGSESIDFEQIEDVWYAKRFAYVVKPGEPKEVVQDSVYMLTVHVTFPDAINRDKWLGEVAKLAQSVQRDEPLCLTFSVSHDEKDPLKVLLLERYASKSAFEAHKQTDAFKQFVQALSSIERQVNASYLAESTTVGFNR
eukprot:gnl/MRDRNA2_/MRDRNA2_98333_c0_seq1.p1 gnl/MRDRNA2_/MRDRNA2_98333_c0~~gnl/MRDRNA2_/MRDRNA2_98333_c0_seq1.p1  ORF type:complete len:305 (+),score=58.57 gnl/MRDRNA2_/MRDRNA2_98333_c0_seq1:101-916(+)